ncbi:MAG: protoporphyrinogen oxidase [Rubripirellula sp.]|nr:protoporphyrinogen oxidase [Rubripirellula sp.]
MNRPHPPRIAIIGGGLSGLATAAQLSLMDPTIELSLFEAGSRTGGVIHTESADGFVLDHGADMFAIQPPGAIELIRQLGLEDRLIEPESTRRGARIVHRGRLVPVPEGFVLMRATAWLPMLTTPLLGVTGKLRFFAERFIPPLREDRDESVSEFVLRRMGRQVLERIVAPLSAGIYTADIQKLSMRATMGPIVEMEQQYGSLAKAAAARRRSGEDSLERSSSGARYGKFRSFPGGMKQFLDSLAAKLPDGTIHFNCPVERLERSHDLEHSNERWRVHLHDQTSQEFDEVVVAVPPQVASGLLRPLSATAASELDSIEMASAAIVVLGVPRGQISEDVDTFGFVVPLSENRRILAGSFASHKFAGRAPEDQVIIRVFIGGAMQPELLERNDDELIQIAREELGELIGLTGEPTLTRVVRWNDAMPQYHLGHLDRVMRIEQEVEKMEGLSLVNNGLRGVGIAPVVTQAGRVAQSVIDRLASSRGSTSGDDVGIGSGTQ